MRCPTPGCDRRLTPYERSAGHIKCAICRRLSTGHPFNDSALAKHRRKEPPPATGPSWWLDAPRDGFFDRATSRTVKTHG